MKLSLSVHDQIDHIRKLIEETNDAYDGICSSGVNADFAEFAVLSLAAFRTALGNPSLSEAELVSLLREGRARHTSLKPPSTWTAFLAVYIGRKANANSRLGAPRAGLKDGMAGSGHQA